jgi:hypothetical protein
MQFMCTVTLFISESPQNTELNHYVFAMSLCKNLYSLISKSDSDMQTVARILPLIISEMF